MQPIPSARARVLTITLTLPSAGVAAGARGGGAQEGARAVALAAPLAAPARSLHPRPTVERQRRQQGSRRRQGASAGRALARLCGFFFRFLLHPWGLNPMCFSVVWGTCEGLGGWFRVAGVSGGCGVCVGTAGFGHAGHNYHLRGKEPSPISCFLAFSTHIGLGCAQTFAQSVHVILRYI